MGGGAEGFEALILGITVISYVNGFHFRAPFTTKSRTVYTVATK